MATADKQSKSRRGERREGGGGGAWHAHLWGGGGARGTGGVGEDAGHVNPRASYYILAPVGNAPGDANVVWAVSLAFWAEPVMGSLAQYSVFLHISFFIKALFSSQNLFHSTCHIECSDT